MVTGMSSGDHRSGGGRRSTAPAAQRGREGELRGRGGAPAHPGGDGDDGTARGGRTATGWWSTAAARAEEERDGVGAWRLPSSILQAEEEKGTRRRRRSDPLGSGRPLTPAMSGGGGGSRGSSEEETRVCGRAGESEAGEGGAARHHASYPPEGGGPGRGGGAVMATAASGSARHGASDGPVATVTGSFCKNPPVAFFLYNFSGIL